MHSRRTSVSASPRAVSTPKKTQPQIDQRVDLDVEHAVDAFRRVLRELRLIARQTELATQLSPAQLFVLMAVAESEGCSVNEIADRTMTDRSSAAAVVDRLVQQGLVTREQSRDDRRRARISITSEGRRAMRRAAPPPTAVLIAALRQLPPAQLHGLSRGLVELTRIMGLIDGPAGMLFDDGRARDAPATGAQRKPAVRSRRS